MENLHNHEWTLTKSPAGKSQFTPVNASEVATVPDAHDPSKKHATFMLTTDLALKMDPVYAGRFRSASLRTQRILKTPSPERGSNCSTETWGPAAGIYGSLAPAEQLLWQDPVPDVDHELIGEQDIADLKAKVLASGLSVSQLVSTAWASAATFRGTDKRGGANGARIRLAPQKDWEVNNPAALGMVLQAPSEQIQMEFNSSQTGGKMVSLADLIVLAGCAGVEQAAMNAGQNVQVPFSPGRTGRARRSGPTWSRLPCSNPPQTGSATTSRAITKNQQKPCWWNGLAC